MILRLVVLVLLLATSAAAQPILIDGFDGGDQSTVNPDSLEFVECSPTSGSGCTIGNDAAVNRTSTRVHNAANGGDDSSRWGGVSTITSATASGYYKICVPTGTGCGDLNPHPFQMTAGINFNLDTAPASGKTRSNLCMIESDGDYGCCLASDNNRKWTLFYAGGTSGGACTTDANCTASFCATSACTCQGGTCRQSWGTTSGVNQLNSCTGNPTFPCSVPTQANDCPSPGTCSSNFYYAGVELTQSISGSSQVTCELHQDGASIFTGTSKTIAGSNPVANIVNVAFGVVDGPGTPSGTETIYFDDLVVDDSARTGYGYVATEYPASTTGLSQQWAPQSGTGCTSTNHTACVNDYNVSPFVYNTGATSSNVVQKNVVGRTEQFNMAAPTLLGLPAGVSLTAVEALSFGTTTVGNAERDMTQTIMFGVNHVPSTSPTNAVCTAVGAPLPCCTGSGTGTCTQVLGPGLAQSTPRLWARYLLGSAPIAGAGTLSLYLNDLAMGATIATGNGDQLRVGTMLLYLRMQRPDVQGAKTLRDRNGDGKVAVATIGDSLLGGTIQQTCINSSNVGATCSQKDYCLWTPDTNPGKDLPAGGCFGDNTNCQTCTLHRDVFNGGGGLKCTAGGNECLAGTGISCNGTTHICETPDGPTPVPCPGGTDAECSLGTCDTTGTCTDSCPGGSCPTGNAGWAVTLANTVRADVIYQCGQGGEQMSEMYVTRFPGILQGKQVTCTVNSGSGQCTCSSSIDCAGGGTCSGTPGVCTTGTQSVCGEAADCSPGQVCALPAPDYVVTSMGFNEENPFSGADRGPSSFGWHDPECTGANTMLSPAIGCPNYGSGQFQLSKAGGALACTKNSDCASVSPYSTCDGWCLGSGDPDHACKDTNDCASCSTRASGCFIGGNNVCGTFFSFGGPTCVGSDPLLPWLQRGQCHCTTDGQCGTGWNCVGDTATATCRKSCTVDANCNTTRNESCATFTGGAGLIPTSGTKQVCQGTCRLPCDAISCTKDADCAPVGGNTLANRWPGFPPGKWIGRCNLARGKCANCGIAACGGNLVHAPCTCTAGSECGSGGTCTNNICVAAPNDAPKVNCRDDTDCAATRQCLRPDTQMSGFKAHWHVPIQVAQAMKDYVSRMYPTTGPALLFMAPPSPGGLASGGTGAYVPAQQCVWLGGFQQFYDTDFIESIRLDYLATAAQPNSWLAKRYVIDPEPTWRTLKMITPLHTDQVHLATAGGAVLSNAVAAALNRLNVCLKTDGVTPQPYCMHRSEAFTNLTCVSNADCTAGDICVSRPCNGSLTACCNDGNSSGTPCTPTGGIVCGPD